MKSRRDGGEIGRARIEIVVIRGVLSDGRVLG